MKKNWFVHFNLTTIYFNEIIKKEESDDKCKKLQTKADMMEKLSRTLQTERNELKEKLKSYEEKDIKEEKILEIEQMKTNDSNDTDTQQTSTDEAPNDKINNNTNDNQSECIVDANSQSITTSTVE